MKHRWSGGFYGAGMENRCHRCGTVRRWTSPMDVLYLFPHLSGWHAESPSCEDVQRAVEENEEKSARSRLTFSERAGASR